MKIRNNVLEHITDELLKEELYKKLKADYPIFFSRHERPIPNYDNVYEYDGVKIIVEPQGKQGEYAEHRVKELYDDLTPNLNDFTDEILTIPKEQAIGYLQGILTQYNAEEVYDYLTNAKRLGELHDFAEFKEIQRYFDKENIVGISTYMFFFKGDFKSFGCTIQTAEAETTKTMLYDGSEDYETAFQYFKNQSPIDYVYLFDRLQGEGKNKNNEME